MSFPIPDCPDTYRDKQRHTQTHRPKDTHTHAHTHTQIHTLGSVLVYTFILGTLYIQICLSKKKKKQCHILLSIFHACISYIRDWWFMLFSSLMSLIISLMLKKRKVTESLGSYPMHLVF